MPIYEYKCKDCGEVFEYLCLNSEDAENATCSSCGSAKTEKLMSMFSSAAGSGGDATGLASQSSCSPRGGFS